MNSNRPAGQQVRVLVVDDDDRVRKDMVAFLEDEGYAVNVPEAAGQVLFEQAKEQARTWRSSTSAWTAARRTGAVSPYSRS